MAIKTTSNDHTGTCSADTSSATDYHIAKCNHATLQMRTRVGVHLFL